MASLVPGTTATQKHNSIATNIAVPATVSISSVFAENFATECYRLEAKLQKCGRDPIVVAFDTEFPGTIFGGYNPGATPEESYKILKANVDSTDIIQLGLTLKNPADNGVYDVWGFNLKDFNLSRGDPHNPDSIKLLKQQGIDFEKNAKDGIDCKTFGKFLNLSGLFNKKRLVTWIGFHTPYDFGYMIKILSGKPLPEKLSDFHNLVSRYFGTQVYDLKYVVKSLPYEARLYGGLNKIAETLKVDRVAGRCHQAGADSLLIMQTYESVLNQFFPAKSLGYGYASQLFGLEIAHPNYYGSQGCNSAPGNYLPQAMMPRHGFKYGY
ncbi:hypothetical protein ACHQM5_030313 [Ranunculus cassubicifolius]